MQWQEYLWTRRRVGVGSINVAKAKTKRKKLWAQRQDYLWTRMTRSSVGVGSAGTASAPKSSLKKNSQNKTEGSLITTSKSIAFEYRGNWSENKKAVISCIYNHNGQLIPSFTDIFPCWSQTVYTKAIVVEFKQIPEPLSHPPPCLWPFHDLGKFLLKASQWWSMIQVLHFFITKIKLPRRRVRPAE